MGDSYLVLRLHLVWGTKTRQQWLDAEWRPRLWAYLAAILAAKRGRLICAGGVRDHLHLYVEPPATMALSDLVGELKSSSTKWIRRTFPHRRDFRWQHGFGAFSVNPHDDARLRSYIRDQELHHREVPFETEYLELLTRYGIRADPARALD